MLTIYEKVYSCVTHPESYTTTRYLNFFLYLYCVEILLGFLANVVLISS